MSSYHAIISILPQRNSVYRRLARSVSSSLWVYVCLSLPFYAYNFSPLQGVNSSTAFWHINQILTTKCRLSTAWISLKLHSVDLPNHVNLPNYSALWIIIYKNGFSWSQQFSKIFSVGISDIQSLASCSNPGMLSLVGDHHNLASILWTSHGLKTLYSKS